MNFRIEKNSFRRPGRRGDALAAVALFQGLLVLGGCQSGSGPSSPSGVSGHYIASISDGDMTATVFADGMLGEPYPDARDLMTVISLPIQEPETPWSQVEVSNSSLGPPTALSITADGKTAFVVESRGHRPSGATTLDELPKGENIAAIDLSNPMAPVTRGSRFVGTSPHSVAAHPGGDLVAVLTDDPRAQLVIVPFVDGQLGEPSSWPLIGLDNDEAAASCVAWHPSGRYLGVTLPDRNEVMFYEFRRSLADGSMGIAPWGEPVKVGKHPFTGVFSPGGKFFLTGDLQWGPDVEGYLVAAPEGTVSVVRLSDTPSMIVDDVTNVDPTVQHMLVSQPTVGISPEGLAISPDGSLVVTANLRRSMLPESDERFTRGGSLTLLTFNNRTGELVPAGEYDMNAMPEGVSFDSAGKFVVVTMYRSFDPNAMSGELGFWKVRTGGKPSLVAQDFFVGVGYGPHGVVIVR